MAKIAPAATNTENLDSKKTAPKAAVKKTAAKKAAVKKTAEPKAVKTKKIDQAVEIFKSHLDKRETLSKKEFRNLVVADMQKQLGVTNKGTLGMYFAWSDQLVSGRGAKQYNRTAPRRAKGANVARDAKDENGKTEEERLNEAVAKVNKTIAGMRAKNATVATPVKVNKKKTVSKKA